MTYADPEAVPANSLRFPTWLCALSPVLSLILIITVAIHYRLIAGGWPHGLFVEEFPDRAFHLHWYCSLAATVSSLLFVPFVWALLICFRRFRLGARTHGIQAVLYCFSWLLFGAASSLEPTGFATWYLD